MLHVAAFLFFCRDGISIKSIIGKTKLATEEIIAPWLETTLATNLSEYPLQYIFNVDEFGRFYQCASKKTYHFKNEN